MLEVRDLHAWYGKSHILQGVHLQVSAGECVSLIGRNGVGRSTTIRAIMGMVDAQGSVRFGDAEILGLKSYQIAHRGLGYVPENRDIFPTLTVRQNLLLGAYNPSARVHRAQSLAWVESLFPILAERADQAAGTMSGGQQQMVAIARGLMARPRLLMIDEPFLGLAPNVVDEILAIVQRINQEGVAVLFTEQNVQLALSVSHRGYLLESGRIVLEGSGREMLEHETVRHVYLGL